MWDDEQDLCHQAIIDEEVENWINEKKNEGPEPILGYPIPVKNSDMGIVCDPKEEAEVDDDDDDDDYKEEPEEYPSDVESNNED